MTRRCTCPPDPIAKGARIRTGSGTARIDGFRFVIDDDDDDPGIVAVALLDDDDYVVMDGQVYAEIPLTDLHPRDVVTTH